MTRRRAAPTPTLARLLVAVALAAGSHLTGPAAGAAAAQGDGVTLSVTGAPEGELALVPGRPTSTRVSVGNPSTGPQRVEIDVTGLRVVDGEFRFDGEPAAGLTVTVDPSRFTLGANERRDVAVTLTAAPGTRPGAAYAGLVVRGLPDARPGEAPVVGEVGLPLLGRVPGEASEAGRIVTFGPERPRVRAGAIPFVVEFEATGDVHVTPVGTVELFAGDRSLGVVDVEQLPVLAGTVRRLPVTWTGETPRGTLRAHLDLRWGEGGRFHETRDATVEVTAAAAGRRRATGSGGNEDGDRANAVLMALLVIAFSLLALLLALAAFLMARERRRKKEAGARGEDELLRFHSGTGTRRG